MRATNRLVKLAPADYWKFCALDARVQRLRQLVTLARTQMALTPTQATEQAVTKILAQLHHVTQQLQVHFAALEKRHRLQPDTTYAPIDADCALRIVGRAKTPKGRK